MEAKIRAGALHYKGEKYPLVEHDDLRYWEDVRDGVRTSFCQFFYQNSPRIRIPCDNGPEATRLIDMCVNWWKGQVK